MLGELIIYVVDCNEAKKIGKNVGQDTTIEEFAKVARELDTAYTLSEFVQKVNDEELQDFSNKFIKSGIVYQGLIVEEF